MAIWTVLWWVALSSRNCLYMNRAVLHACSARSCHPSVRLCLWVMQRFPIGGTAWRLCGLSSVCLLSVGVILSETCVSHCAVLWSFAQWMCIVVLEYSLLWECILNCASIMSLFISTVLLPGIAYKKRFWDADRYLADFKTDVKWMLCWWVGSGNHGIWHK